MSLAKRRCWWSQGGPSPNKTAVLTQRRNLHADTTNKRVLCEGEDRVWGKESTCQGGGIRASPQAPRGGRGSPSRPSAGTRPAEDLSAFTNLPICMANESFPTHVPGYPDPRGSPRLAAQSRKERERKGARRWEARCYLCRPFPGMGGVPGCGAAHGHPPTPCGLPKLPPTLPSPHRLSGMMGH